MSASLKAIQSLVKENGIWALNYYFKLGLVPSDVDEIVNGGTLIPVSKQDQHTIVDMSQFFLVTTVISNYNHPKSAKSAERTLSRLNADNLIISQEYRILWGALLYLMRTGASVITTGVIAHTLSNPDIDLVIDLRTNKQLAVSMTERTNIANKLLDLQVLDDYLINPNGLEIATDTFVEHCRQSVIQFIHDSFIELLGILRKRNASTRQFQEALSNYKKDLARLESAGFEDERVFDFESYARRKMNNEIMVDLAYPIKGVAKWLSGGEHTYFGISPLTLLIGASNTGKTTIGLNMSFEYAMAGYKVLFWTAEQDTDYIEDLFGSILTETPYWRVRYGDDKTKKAYLNKLEAHPNFANFLPVYGEAGSDFWQDARRIEDKCASFLPDIVVVDNLDRYKHTTKQHEAYGNHIAISHWLQDFSHDSLKNYGKNIYTLLLVQGKKTVDFEEVKYNAEGYMAGAGQVYKNADRAFFIYRDFKSGQSALIHAKGREGKSATADMLYYDVHDKRVLWAKT